MPEIRCPKCGSRMILPTTAEDDFRHYVCSNRPTCTEMIAVEDAWSYMWEEGRPDGLGAGGIKQSAVSSRSGAGIAARMLEGSGLWLRLIFKRSKRKDKAPLDAVRDNNKDRLGMIPQAAFRETESMGMREVAHYQPKQPGASEKKAAGERKELPRALTEHSHEEEVVSEKKIEILEEKKPARHWWGGAAGEGTDTEAKEPPKTQQSGALSGEIHLKQEEPLRPQPRMAPKPGIVPEVEEPSKSRPLPLLAPEKELSTRVKWRFRHWRRRAPEREAANRGNELSKPRPQLGLKRAASPDGKELLGPVQRGTEANLAVPEIKEPDKPVEPMSPGVYAPDRAEEGLSHQPPGVVQSDMDAREKKNFLIIIVIAMAVACIVVIAGLIYSVFVLR